MYLNRVTSQKDIMRQCELISETTKSGITGLGPADTLSLEREGVSLALRRGQGLICSACYANVQ